MKKILNNFYADGSDAVLHFDGYLNYNGRDYMVRFTTLTNGKRVLVVDESANTSPEEPEFKYTAPEAVFVKDDKKFSKYVSEYYADESERPTLHTIPFEGKKYPVRGITIEEDGKPYDYLVSTRELLDALHGGADEIPFGKASWLDSQIEYYVDDVNDLYLSDEELSKLMGFQK